MPLDFPSSPVLNDTYSLGPRTWKYNGYGWEMVGAVVGYTGSRGSLGYTGSIGFTGSLGPAGSFTPWTVKTSNYTASTEDRIIADTSGGSFNITLPSSPTVGHYIQITDGSDFEINNLTVVRNGSTIEGFADDVLITLGGATFEFIYDGSTWQVTSTFGPQGYTGSQGYSGSQGITGYTGSSPTTWTEIVTFEGTLEVMNALTGATGVVDHDFTLGAVWYHSSAADNFTANFTNVPTTNDRSLSIALIISQGVIAYIPTAIQINGVAQTIKWQGGSTPSGNSTKTDVVSFNLVRTGSAWTVLGHLTSFG